MAWWPRSKTVWHDSVTIRIYESVQKRWLLVGVTLGEGLGGIYH